jgi:hypothetical protein
VDADVDTLLTALYCFTDDLLITRRLPGRPSRSRRDLWEPEGETRSGRPTVDPGQGCEAILHAIL